MRFRKQTETYRMLTYLQVGRRREMLASLGCVPPSFARRLPPTRDERFQSCSYQPRFVLDACCLPGTIQQVIFDNQCNLHMH
jgi:hypothetical protein